MVMVELFNLIYEQDKKTLKYDVTPYNATTIKLSNEFGLSTLIIDVFLGEENIDFSN